MNRNIATSLRIGAAISVASLSAYGALPTGYRFDLTASYLGSAPADLYSGMPVGGPDTGYLTIINSGLTTFSGQLSLSGVTPSSVSFVSTIPSITLAPGAHVSLSLNAESSNQGGYGDNGPGNPQNGAQFTINGNVTDGVDTEAVFLQVYDKDIHSGTFQTNPFGVSLDNYILQGGDPFGRDTGDAFEESQAPGHYSFVEEAASTGVPDIGNTAPLLLGALGALSIFRRKNQ